LAVIHVSPVAHGTPAPQISPQESGVGGVVGIGVAVGILTGLVGNGVDPGPSVLVQVDEVQLIPAVEQAESQFAPVLTAIYELPHLHF
jgi:hypothetical protein